MEFLHRQEIVGFSWFRIGVSILGQENAPWSIVAFERHPVSGEVEEQAIVVSRWLELLGQPLGEQGSKLVYSGLALSIIRDQFNLILILIFQ